MTLDHHREPKARQNIRFSPEQWELVRSVSDLEGVSASQFVREATLVRAVYIGLLRGVPQAQLIGLLFDAVGDSEEPRRDAYDEIRQLLARVPAHDGSSRS